MNKFAEALKAELHRIADLNHDGKVDKTDVMIAVQNVESTTEHHPFAAVIVASGVSMFITWAVMRITGC